MIGRYAAENGPTHASKHFSKLLRKNIRTTGKFKKEYLLTLKELLKEKPDVQLFFLLSLKCKGLAHSFALYGIPVFPYEKCPFLHINVMSMHKTPYFQQIHCMRLHKSNSTNPSN